MATPPRAERGLHRLLGSLAVLAGSLVVGVVAFLLLESLDALRAVGVPRFLSDEGWSPAGGPEGRFNLVPMLTGTAALTLGALLLATPAAVGAALFCRFYAPPRLAHGLRSILEVLAGVPSVVYGFWGLVTLVPLIQRLRPPGQSLLAGCLILGLMVLPTIALVSESALRSLPRPWLDGGAALGLDRWAVVRGIALPAALPGIVTGVLLATVRALGETMAVLMVCGNVVQVPASLFDPIRSLTANIALEMAYAGEHHRSALFVSGLLLMLAVGALIVLVDRLEPVRQHHV